MVICAFSVKAKVQTQSVRVNEYKRISIKCLAKMSLRHAVNDKRKETLKSIWKKEKWKPRFSNTVCSCLVFITPSFMENTTGGALRVDKWRDDTCCPPELCNTNFGESFIKIIYVWCLLDQLSCSFFGIFPGPIGINRKDRNKVSDTRGRPSLKIQEGNRWRSRETSFHWP